MPCPIGVDLGTVHASVAIWRDGRIEIIPDAQGCQRIPYSTLLVDELRRAESDATFPGPSNIWSTTNERRRLTVIIRQLKFLAETYLHQQVTDAFITVPALSSSLERQVVRDAGHMAGLNCVRLLNAPTAAGITHWMEQHHADEYTTLILDIGASRAEATVLKVSDGIFEVRSCAADTLLGGRAYDARLLHFFSLWETSGCQDECLGACESLKVSLSKGEPGQFGYDLRVTREQFEDICGDLFRATVTLVERALRDAKYSKLDVAEVIMAGGSVQMPMLQKVISDFFDHPCTVIHHPEMASVRGSALYAAASFSPGSIPAMLVIDMKPSSVHLEIPAFPLVQLYPRNVVSGNNATAYVVFISGKKLPRYLRLIEKDVIPTLIGIFDLTLLASEFEMSQGLVLRITADIDMDGIINASIAPVSPDVDAEFCLPLKRQTTPISEKPLLQSCIKFLKVLTRDVVSPPQQNLLQAVISQTELELYSSPQGYENESLALCGLFQKVESIISSKIVPEREI